jgi:hypothetical protein
MVTFFLYCAIIHYVLLVKYSNFSGLEEEEGNFTTRYTLANLG